MIQQGKRYHKNGQMYTVKSVVADTPGGTVELEDSSGHIIPLTFAELTTQYSGFIETTQLIK